MKKIKEPFVMIPTSIARNPDISPIAKTVYMAVRSYDPSFPSYKKLCADTGIKSKSTLRKYLNQLVMKQLIKITSGGFNQSNNYEILPSPYSVTPEQNMNSPIAINGPTVGQNMDSNNINLIKSNKSHEGSSAIASEEPQGIPVDEKELSLTLSNIRKGIF